ncbi:DUF1127 domain-containing protein [Bradyrhizobium sp. STM 3557]|uniref:DUF1127 domain-containing protein n=1 Tax=Bradyrhizobium sp. STM 3557 TaxID=578920 RepID=UPI003890F95B
MPPHTTNPTSERGRDAAGLSLDVAIALVKDVMGDALTAARPDASIATLRDASTEKDAAGPPAAPGRSLFGSLKQHWRALQEGRRRRRMRVSLRDLDERQLMDIGLTPGEIDYITAHRALERLRDDTKYLWLSRGVT